MQNTLSTDKTDLLSNRPEDSALIHLSFDRSANASLSHQPFNRPENSALIHLWEQSWELITIVIPDCTAADKKNLTISVKRDTIEIKYKDAVLAGRLQYPVYPDDTTWYYNNGSLYIELSKVDQHKWWQYIVGGTQEKEIPLEPRKKHEYPDYVQAMLDRKGEELRFAQTRPDLFASGNNYS